MKNIIFVVLYLYGSPVGSNAKAGRRSPFVPVLQGPEAPVAGVEHKLVTG